MSDGADTLSIVLGDEASSRRYRSAFVERQERLKKTCANSRVRMETLMTDDEPLVVLQRLLR